MGTLHTFKPKQYSMILYKIALYKLNLFYSFSLAPFGKSISFKERSIAVFLYAVSAMDWGRLMQNKTFLIFFLITALSIAGCSERSQNDTADQIQNVKYISRELSPEERTQLKEEIKKEVIEELLAELNSPESKETQIKIQKLREIIEELKKQENYEP